MWEGESIFAIVSSLRLSPSDSGRVLLPLSEDSGPASPQAALPPTPSDAAPRSTTLLKMTSLGDTFALSYPSRRYRSALIGIIVHSSQSVLVLALILSLVLK